MRKLIWKIRANDVDVLAVNKPWVISVIHEVAQKKRTEFSSLCHFYKLCAVYNFSFSIFLSSVSQVSFTARYSIFYMYLNKIHLISTYNRTDIRLKMFVVINLHNFPSNRISVRFDERHSSSSSAQFSGFITVFKVVKERTYCQGLICFHKR